VLPEALAPELDGWRYAGGDPAIARAAARELGALVRGWLERSSGHAVIHLPAARLRPATGIADAALPDGARAVAAAFAEELAACAREVTRAHVLDETAVLLRIGAAAEDASLHFHAGLELSGPAIAAVGSEAARFILALRRRPIKCLVVDLDNTLWGGIVGEDGVAGLSLAGEFPGEAHRDLQRWLLAHHRAGVLLAICSRNEPADALAAFDERPDMILRREHFASISVDWRPKPERLLEIARELNIGADAIAFLDDSPFERATVREALPEVPVPHLPADVARWVEHLAELHLTDALTLTEEDRRRAAMYAEDLGRRDLAVVIGDMQAFLSDLESLATLSLDQPALTARTAQLCARTNQFNLSAHRHSEGRIAQFITDPHTRVIQMRASDRFGDLGITGIAIVTADGERAHLDTFLMSCRALGRGFEEALLAEAWRVAEEQFGARELHAQWLDDGRNTQVREFLQRTGAQEHSRAGSADFVIDRPVAWPEHIRRREA
jgi:FkbH-like protein